MPLFHANSDRHWLDERQRVDEVLERTQAQLETSAELKRAVEQLQQGFQALAQVSAELQGMLGTTRDSQAA